MVRFIKSLFVDGNRLIDPLDERGPRRPYSFPGKSASLENGGLGTQLPNLVRTARHAAATMRHKWNHRLAGKVEEKFKKDGKGVSVAEGLVSSTLLFCVGSMTVTGSIQAGLTGDNSVLITKAMLDLVSSMMLASSLGIGVMLSSVAVFVIQGGLVLLAGLISPVMSAGAINEMTCAGSILIIMIGTNLMGITKIKVADFLPAILFAPVIYNIVPLIEKLWSMIVS